MKKIFRTLTALLAGVVALGAYSCEQVNDREMMVTPSTIDLGYSRETPTPVRVSVEAGHEWYVQSTCEWITVTNVTGTGFTLEFDGTYFEMTPESRSGVVLVSSQLGQWPVIVNQDRTPFSTIEEYEGTYRFKMTQYDMDTYAATGVWDDVLIDIFYYGEYEMDGAYYDMLSSDQELYSNIDSRGSNSFIDFFFEPETGGIYIAGLGYPASLGSSLTLPCAPDQNGTGIYLLFGKNNTFYIDPETKKLTVPTVYEGRQVYWNTIIVFAGLMTTYSEFYDIEITKVANVDGSLPAPGMDGSPARPETAALDLPLSGTVSDF